MKTGRVTKLTNSFGSTWGHIRPDGQARDVFFNLSSLVDAEEFAHLALGDAVEFEEEPDRANGMHALRMTVTHRRHHEVNDGVPVTPLSAEGSA